VTLTTNAGLNLTESLKQFIKRAMQINEIEQRPFCYKDFNLTKANFRQKLYLLKSYIIKVIDGRQAFYKIKGIDLPGSSHDITLKPMRFQEQLDIILTNLKEQPPMIHDLKFKVISNLHEKLLSKGLTPNKKNNCIVLTNINSPDSNLYCKIIAYPKHFQLDVGCTYKPIIYDVSGLQNFTFVMGEYVNLLRIFVGDDFSMQPISEWVITHYHFNRDGTESLSGQSFHYTFEDFSGSLIRVYSKEFQDGKRRARVESIQTPNITMREKIMEIANLNISENS